MMSAVLSVEKNLMMLKMCSVSGIFGIDSLGLFGSEAGGTDAKTALKMASAH